MELTRTETEFFIYSSDYTGEKQGKTVKTGNLEAIKLQVFEMLKTTSLPSLPVPVAEVTTNPKPSNTILLIEIEEGKAYKIKPSFNMTVRTNARTWAGGFLNIIAKAEGLINKDE